MASIKIPESVLPGIKAIGLLSEKENSNISEILRKFPKGSTMDELEITFGAATEKETAELISQAIYSFGYLLVRDENKDGDLAKKLTESFLNETSDDEISQSLADILPERLNDILVLCDFLIPTFEAYRVVWDNNYVLRNTEISSEIVILNDKSYQIPASGVILNKLNLEIRGNDDNEKRSVVLDEADLKTLKNQIEVTLQEIEEMKRGYKKFINFIKL